MRYNGEVLVTPNDVSYEWQTFSLNGYWPKLVVSVIYLDISLSDLHFLDNSLFMAIWCTE